MEHRGVGQVSGVRGADSLMKKCRGSDSDWAPRYSSRDRIAGTGLQGRDRRDVIAGTGSQGQGPRDGIAWGGIKGMGLKRWDC